MYFEVTNYVELKSNWKFLLSQFAVFLPIMAADISVLSSGMNKLNKLGFFILYQAILIDFFVCDKREAYKKC